MTSFSFTRVKRKSNKQSTTSSIVYKDVEGFVGIRLDGSMYVKYNNEEYDISSKCYDCKGKELIYSSKLYNRKDGKGKTMLSIARLKDNRGSCNPNTYYPFAPGLVVVGDIVQTGSGINIKHKFTIKKCYKDANDIASMEAYQYWKDNYDVIENNKHIIVNE